MSCAITGYFDCKRQGQDCANEQTCSDNGTCDCGSSYTGYNCGLSMSEKGQTPCTSETDSCGSDGGLCYKNETAKACYCPANLYGDHCENKRYTVECMQSSMKITLTPAGTFNGVIYVHGKKETDGCTFTDTSGTLELDLQDSSDCGEVTSNTESGDRSRVIMMQYSSKYITDRDTKLTVTCSGGAGTVNVTAAFISQDGNNKEQAISGTNPIDIASDAVDFVIKLKDDSVVNNATVVSLNDQLTFQFDVNGEKAPGGQSCEYSVINDTTMTVEPDVTLSETSVEDCKKACNANPQCKFFTHLRDSCMIRYVSSETDYNPDEQFYEKHCASTATLTVMQCEASNGQSGDNKETMKLIENICPSEEVGKLMEQDPTRDTNNQVVF
ncbi:EGF-like domain-containing protein 1 [Gigantopelta aegis]|uniref:EGF-like domain-containing protein 1 n=1 Tax=Gigantopelta aegis TaxID=1735272 RepID=UPI001B88AA58|nr:EGF-like domain-containing protein 1 [Gigantopelta aegis]